MGVFIEVVTVLVEIALLLYYLNGIFGMPKVHRSHVFCGFAGFGIVLALLSIFPLSPIIRLFFSMIYTLALGISVYKTKFLTGLYTIALYYSMAIVADILCSGILELLGMPVEQQLYSQDADRIIYNTVAKLVHLIGIQIVLILFRRHRQEGSLGKAIPLIIGEIASIIICHQFYLNIISNISPKYTIIEIIGMLYLNIVLCFYIDLAGALYESKQEAKLAEQQLAIQQSYYEQVSKNQEETRSLWHDIKKYVNAIQTVAGEKNTESVLSCLKQTEESFEKIHKVADVGNQIVNGVLEYGLNKAEQAGIKIELDVWVSPSLSVSPIDLYIIIGNTIDNAIEECSHFIDSSKKVIHIVLKQKNSLLYYEIKNSIAPGVNKKEGLIHGYGLKNVRKCIEKYHGIFLTEAKDGVFTASAQLSI